MPADLTDKKLNNLSSGSGSHGMQLKRRPTEWIDEEPSEFADDQTA